MLSVVLNAAVLVLLASEPVRKWLTASEAQPPVPPPPAEHVLQMIFSAPEAEAAPPDEENRPRFARTSDNQLADSPPDRSDFIGERDTRATSELAPAPDAPDLPAQAGIEPLSPDHIETTESSFRDGPLDGADATPPATPAPTTPEVAGAQVDTPGQSETPEASLPPPPPTDRLLEGPLTTDVQTPLTDEPETEKPEAQEPSEAPRQGVADAPADRQPEADPTPEPIVDPTQSTPGFRGHQRKTAVRGSISRTGRSALNVEDSPLGRYQAKISRAVELEWQRNCVRHRDFITPGFLTVRFFVEHNGRVRSVQFVGQMETGEVQKGFTLNSIRNAPIPPMPAELRHELGDEPLELIFNFYF